MALRILHVVESYGGGVATALDSYVRATSEHEHFLARRIRTAAHMEDDAGVTFAEVFDLPAALIAAGLEVRKLVRNVRPDVVHAHSSIAGGIVRSAPLSRPTPRIVYTPHCFAFERRDVGRPTRWIFKGIESVLAYRTDSFAACSPREARLAASFPAHRGSVLVPNVADASRHDSNHDALGRSICAVGRLSAQKDPRFFLRCVQALRAAGAEADAVWLGDGDAHLRDLLVKAGVRVTGWLPPSRVRAELARSGVYLHTASWEGSPMSVLEAVADEVPVIARRIPAFAGAPTSGLIDDPREAADRVLTIFRDAQRRDSLIREWSKYYAGNTRAAQREALEESYGLPKRGHHT